MELIAGFFLGIIASILAWYIQSHLIIPKIGFFPNIYKEKNDEHPAGYRYLIRFRNRGLRNIIDVEIIAELRVHGIYDFKKWAWKAIYIPIDDYKIPKVMSHRKSSKRRAVQLCIYDLSTEAKAALPKELQGKCEQRNILLEDLLQLGDKAELKIYMFGYDSFSGSRKLFESKIYGIQDILIE